MENLILITLVALMATGAIKKYKKLEAENDNK
jgi:hypothetical protein